MLYFVAAMLVDSFNVLNVLTYHTVRAGGAAVTGFALCLLFGPALIRRLRALKIGQYIKKDHVENLHELHKGKAGTPTMGGAMIIGGTILSLLLWGRFSSRMLWMAVFVFLLLGIVGFMDDFIKLRRKHNDGLSARAKFIGQIITGTVLGLFLYFNPVTVSASYVYPRDVIDWGKLEGALSAAASPDYRGPLRGVWEMFPEEARRTILDASREGVSTERDRSAVLQGLNTALRNRGLYKPGVWPLDGATPELAGLLRHGAERLGERDVLRLNRLLIEAALPGVVAPSMPNLHTKVGIPGFKDWFIPLGILYIPFVIFVIVSISNAVNLTDGLDGLAAGISVISVITYAGIAYVVSRADWSQYLYLTYVPEASELFVFGGALLGTGLGFLWFNGHPAEVFMGDTGSLSLGGAIGAMALMTKQELLLPVVAGMFVLEAASVVIQVASFKLTGRRVFRMAPLHHHFELLGWVETKVTMRFWIVALLFAMMSLATLKLR